ncbi:MAG: hypothetical protein PVH54_05240 [Gammaproteobacteria bacterium]
MDNDIENFPAGLVYTVAASKAICGEQVYGIDLETEQTSRIGGARVNGSSLNSNSVDGMSLDPLDGYLYAVAKPGDDSQCQRRKYYDDIEQPDQGRRYLFAGCL